MVTTDSHVSQCDDSDQAVTDWDDAYANAAHIVDAARWLEDWPRRAREFRDSLHSQQKHEIAESYGDHPREVMHVYRPTGRPQGVAVIVHGGYWLRFDADTFAQLARGALERNWVVAMPSYPLCPDVRIAEITASIARAVSVAAKLADGPIRLAGHSAGGHLVTRQICTDAPLDPSVQARVDRVLSISGVHDLHPLRNTSMNAHFALTESDATQESPTHQRIVDGVKITAWVGGEERPEFLRQTALLRDAWGEARVHTHVEAGKHHFDVIDDLERADSAMVELWLGD